MPPPNEPEEIVSKKVEIITVSAGAGLAALSLLGLALTKGSFRPVGFLSLAVIGLIVAVVGAFELRKVRRNPPSRPQG